MPGPWPASGAGGLLLPGPLGEACPALALGDRRLGANDGRRDSVPGFTRCMNVVMAMAGCCVALHYIIRCDGYTVTMNTTLA